MWNKICGLVIIVELLNEPNSSFYVQDMCAGCIKVVIYRMYNIAESTENLNPSIHV